MNARLISPFLRVFALRFGSGLFYSPRPFSIIPNVQVIPDSLQLHAFGLILIAER